MKKVASIAFTGAAAAVAAGFNAVPAFASGATWKVSPNGAYSALNQSGAATLTAGAVTLTCPTSTAFASGSLVASAAGSTAQVGTVNATFGASGVPCTFGTIQFSAHLVHPAQLWASAYHSGVTQGAIKSISASINGLNLTCHAKVTGSSIPATFDNATHALTVNQAGTKTLTVGSVTGCLGALQNGQSAGFTAKYNILSPSGVTITDP
jgi:hypothetical protein